MNTILYDYVCEELEDVERDGLKAGNLDSTDKLVNIKKNLLKIEKYESEMDAVTIYKSIEEGAVFTQFDGILIDIMEEFRLIETSEQGR